MLALALLHSSVIILANTTIAIITVSLSKDKNYQDPLFQWAYRYEPPLQDDHPSESDSLCLESALETDPIASFTLA